MKKELPKVFANKIDKVLNNNETVSYGFKEKKEEFNESIIEKNQMSVEEKIQEIFNSPRYVYKANVKIKLKDGVVTKQIIGKNNTHLITMENDLIPINDVLDIDFAD
ncbi:MAG: hypothetical protein GX190_01220 [Mollicutes bacterium]|nr:hypothetical protein [Mollicutes bacterium]